MGVDGTLPWRLLVESLSFGLQDEVYITGKGALRACDVIQDGGHRNRNREIEIVKRGRKLEIVNTNHVKYYIIKHFAAFLKICAFFT